MKEVCIKAENLWGSELWGYRSSHVGVADLIYSEQS